jgi:hypothetical protein
MMAATPRMRRAMLLAVAVSASGCATLINGTRQRLTIDSTPSGARVTVLPAGITFETPGEVELARRNVHTVRVAFDGYCPETIYIDRVASDVAYGNLLLGGFIGLLVDTENGSAFTLEPDTVAVTLRRIDEGAACGIPVCR